MFRENCYAWVFSFLFLLWRSFFSLRKIKPRWGNERRKYEVAWDRVGVLKSVNCISHWDWLVVSIYTKRFLKKLMFCLQNIISKWKAKNNGNITWSSERIFHPFFKHFWNKHSHLFMILQSNRITLLVVARAFYCFKLKTSVFFLFSLGF